MSKDDALSVLAYFPALAIWKPKLTLRGITLPEDSVWRVMRRLAGNAVQRDNGCVLWDGTRTPDGYGRMNVWVPGAGRVQEYVHRLSWRLATGREIPSGKEIDHRHCDCPECINPAHLLDATLRSNRSRAAYNTNVKRRRAAMAGTEEISF